MPSAGNTRKGRCGDAVRYLLRSPTPHKRLHEVYDTVDVFLDFDCHPKESEQELFNQLDDIIINLCGIINDISCYGTGAADEVRKALQNPDDLNIQFRTFEKIQKFALRISSYYGVSKRIEEVIPCLMSELVSGNLSPAEQIDSAQALCKQFARLIDLIFRFDFLKMSTPALQNDFSFYRRIISHSEVGIGKDIVPLEEANTVSLFIANATPMLQTLVNSTTEFIQNSAIPNVSSAAETFAAVSYICRNMVEKEFDSLSDTKMFLLRLMVGSIVLFDHIDVQGAFAKESPIDLKSMIEVLKQNGGQDTEELMNVLRYSTKHFKDQETTKSIRALLS